jgi:hypothetical protein
MITTKIEGLYLEQLTALHNKSRQLRSGLSPSQKLTQQLNTKGYDKEVADLTRMLQDIDDTLDDLISDIMNNNETV